MPKKKDALLHIGIKIKQIRLDKKLSLNFIANEIGLSPDFLHSVESGEKRPPVGTLLQISRALGVDSGLLLKDQGTSAEERLKAYTKRTDNYAYSPLTSGAENKHLKAFRISIEPHKTHEGVGFQHEGEEFSYVLKGQVEITVGDHVNTLGAGDSLHFNSGIKHNLKNIGDTEAELVVVVYTP